MDEYDDIQTSSKKKKRIRYVYGGDGGAGGVVLWGGSLVAVAVITVVSVKTNRKRTKKKDEEEACKKSKNKCCCIGSRDEASNGLQLLLENSSPFLRSRIFSPEKMDAMEVDSTDFLDAQSLIPEGKTALDSTILPEQINICGDLKAERIPYLDCYDNSIKQPSFPVYYMADHYQPSREVIHGVQDKGEAVQVADVEKKSPLPVAIRCLSNQLSRKFSQRAPEENGESSPLMKQNDDNSHCQEDQKHGHDEGECVAKKGEGISERSCRNSPCNNTPKSVWSSMIKPTPRELEGKDTNSQKSGDFVGDSRKKISQDHNIDSNTSDEDNNSQHARPEKGMGILQMDNQCQPPKLTIQIWFLFILASLLLLVLTHCKLKPQYYNDGDD
ncbi:hypothetical protein Ancab_021845 [Ancistrocladus abbreviatus]